MSWYVIETYEGQTSQVVLLLARSQFDVWRPFEIRRSADRRSQSGRKRTASGPAKPPRRYARFGRYFFIRCDLSDAIYHEIKHTAGVHTWLSGAGGYSPLPIADQVIEFLKENLPERPPHGWQELIYKGQRVTIIPDYPLFGGRKGLVKSIDKRGILKVDLENQFGSPIPIIIEVGHVVEGLAQAKPPASKTGESSRAKKLAAVA